jgi:hypothetical protein
MNINELNPVASSRKMNSLMESRFGFALDFDKLTYKKAQNLCDMINENLGRIRHSFGIHRAERNPRYMELLMVRESLTKWMNENRQLFESEMGKSEAILAAKDMVDSIQDMVEKVSKMQVEQLPALLDTIRDQIGTSEADSFKNVMSQLLTNISQELGRARETADTSARQLAGEDMTSGGLDSMGTQGSASGNMSAMDAMKTTASNSGESSDLDSDSFGGTDAAVGGVEPVGRDKR